MIKSFLRDVRDALGIQGRQRVGVVEDVVAPAAVGALPIVSNGVVVWDFDVSDQYPGAVRRTVPVIPMMHANGRRELVLNVFETQDVAITTLYLPIDLKTGRLFANLTYEGVLHFWSPRAIISNGRYEFRCESPEIISQKSVIVGGPVDSNYYHWMLNWLARIAILKMLRPDLLADREVMLLMDWRSKASPYWEFLQAIGIDETRVIWVDHANDYLVKDAVMVSFGNQHVMAPAVIGELREMFGALGREAVAAPRPRRLWISRQQLGPNRRRIHNMDELRPLLAAYDLEEVTLEGLPIAEQIALFQGAEFIVSVHGAGLTNIIFCRSDCQVLAFDSAAHLRFGAAEIYEALAQACGLAYRSLRVLRAPRPADVERNWANVHNQDLIVPVERLEKALREMLGAPLTTARRTD